jgi:hypothetical protein
MPDGHHPPGKCCGICTLVSPGSVIAITPPHWQLHVETLSNALNFAICTDTAPGVQGELVAGMQGCGVSTPKAAAVAAVTCGLDGLLHMPNGMMLVIGTWSITVAAGCFSVCTWLAGSTTKVEGALPNGQDSFAPFTTLIAMSFPPVQSKAYADVIAVVQPRRSKPRRVVKTP